MDKTSDTVSQPQLNVFFRKHVHGHGVSSQQYNTKTDRLNALCNPCSLEETRKGVFYHIYKLSFINKTTYHALQLCQCVLCKVAKYKNRKTERQEVVWKLVHKVFQ